MLRALFERAGEPAAWSVDPGEAEWTARLLRPDAVVLDVTMPGVDGLAVAAALRASDDPGVAAVPIVMYSALSDPATRAAATAAGVTDYVVKGAAVAHLRDRVLGLLPARAGSPSPSPSSSRPERPVNP
jgi:DNA-binding response OmpR family regulator